MIHELEKLTLYQMLVQHVRTVDLSYIQRFFAASMINIAKKYPDLSCTYCASQLLDVFDAYMYKQQRQCLQCVHYQHSNIACLCKNKLRTAAAQACTDMDGRSILSTLELSEAVVLEGIDRSNVLQVGPAVAKAALVPFLCRNHNMGNRWTRAITFKDTRAEDWLTYLRCVRDIVEDRTLCMEVRLPPSRDLADVTDIEIEMCTYEIDFRFTVCRMYITQWLVEQHFQQEEQKWQSQQSKPKHDTAVIEGLNEYIETFHTDFQLGALTLQDQDPSPSTKPPVRAKREAEPSSTPPKRPRAVSPKPTDMAKKDPSPPAKVEVNPSPSAKTVGARIDALLGMLNLGVQFMRETVEY